jgi:hypothetical protein
MGMESVDWIEVTGCCERGHETPVPLKSGILFNTCQLLGYQEEQRFAQLCCCLLILRNVKEGKKGLPW